MTSAMLNFINALRSHWGNVITTTDFIWEDIAPSCRTAGIANLFGEHLPIIAGFPECPPLHHLNTIVERLLTPVDWRMLRKLVNLSMDILGQLLNGVANIGFQASARIPRLLAMLEEMNGLSRFLNSCTTLVN